MAETWAATPSLLHSSLVRVVMLVAMCDAGEKSRLVSSDPAALATTPARAKRQLNSPSSSYLYNLAMVDFGECIGVLSMFSVGCCCCDGIGAHHLLFRLLGRFGPPDMGEYQPFHTMGKSPDRAISRTSIWHILTFCATSKTEDTHRPFGSLPGIAMAPNAGSVIAGGRAAYR